MTMTNTDRLYIAMRRKFRSPAAVLERLGITMDGNLEDFPMADPTRI